MAESEADRHWRRVKPGLYTCDNPDAIIERGWYGGWYWHVWMTGRGWTIGWRTRLRSAKKAAVEHAGKEKGDG